MPSVDARFDERLAVATETYLDQLDACVARLPRLVDAFEDGDGYRETATTIGDLESGCDRTHRRVSALVGDADVQDLGIRLSRVHLHAGQTIELYHALDAVANAAEQFADDLVAIGPPRAPELLALLGEMAACAADAMAALETAVTGFLTVLCEPNESVSVADAVEDVRAAESDCDRLRSRVVTRAFGDGETDQPLVYRALADRLDAVVDAMEDVTDRMIRLAGTELSFDVEPEPEAANGA
ncbi:MAG: hypothetical protein ABEJ88_02410 [Halobacterium sp.]